MSAPAPAAQDTVPLRPAPHRLDSAPVTRRAEVIATALVVQLATLPVVLLLAAERLRPALVAASTATAVLLAFTPWAGDPVARWLTRWLNWAGRRRRSRATGADGNPAHPLTVLTSRLEVGAIAGPWKSEIGVLHGPHGWSSTLWVTDGPQAANTPGGNGLARLLDLTPSGTAATRVTAVLQRSSPEPPTTQDASVVTAWLTVRADPLRSLTPRDARLAVPALLRSEIRHLLDQSADGSLTLTALDAQDLAAALAASSEIPLAPVPQASSATEAWGSWSACGRHHRAFAVRPTVEHHLGDTVALLLGAADLFAGVTATAAIEFGAAERGRRYPVTLRLSHRLPTAVDEVTRRMQASLRAHGIRYRPLQGRQAAALLATCVAGARDVS